MHPLTRRRSRALVVTLMAVAITFAVFAAVMILRAWQDRELQDELREVRRERGLRVQRQAARRPYAASVREAAAARPLAQNPVPYSPSRRLRAASASSSTPSSGLKRESPSPAPPRSSETSAAWSASSSLLEPTTRSR